MKAKVLSSLKAALLLSALIPAADALAQVPTTPPIPKLPLVDILTPADGQDFLLGAPIQISAVSVGFTNGVASVEFLAGTNLLGVVTNDSRALFDELAVIVWTNAAAGDYTLSAIATSPAGLSVTSAPVSISVVTNVPPVVQIVTPRNGATILGPTNILLSAVASDRIESIATVTFYNGSNALGTVTNPPAIILTNHQGVITIQNPTYSLDWSNVAPGAYTLTAVATDSGGVSTTSTPVDITVVTNLPPVVRLIEPLNGSRYFAPATIGLLADASSASSTIASVAFYAGTTEIGVATNGFTVTNGLLTIQNLYPFTWTNVGIGAYTLTAVATDATGASTTSEPVNVTVTNRPPPQIAILLPLNGEMFHAPAEVTIAAVTKNFTNPIAETVFYSGTNALGVVTNSPWPVFFWKAVPAGAYSLTATATDTKGNSATSTNVDITVTTNRVVLPVAASASAN